MLLALYFCQGGLLSQAVHSDIALLDCRACSINRMVWFGPTSITISSHVDGGKLLAHFNSRWKNRDHSQIERKDLEIARNSSQLRDS